MNLKYLLFLKYFKIKQNIIDAEKEKKEEI